MSIKLQLIRNNPDKLLNYFNTSASDRQQAIVVSRLIILKADKHLYKIIDTPFHDKIINELIEIHKNDKEKLFDLYKKSTSIEPKKRIIDILEEVNALDELEKLIDSEFKNQISIFLINRYQESPEKLLNIFYKGISEKSKKNIVQNLLSLKACKELWQLLDTSFRDDIIPKLVIMYRNHSLKLYKLFSLTNNIKISNQIIDYLFNLKAKDELFKLLSTPYKSRINKFLVENAKDNDEILLKYYLNIHFTEVKRLILNKITSLCNLDLLWHIFEIVKSATEKNIIAQYILKLNQENSKELVKLFYKLDFFDLKKSIVLHLMRLESKHELWQLVNSEFKEQILPNLIDDFKDEAGKQYSLFFKTKNEDQQKDIVNNLIHIEADNELKKLLSTNMQSPISRYFFYKYIDQPYQLQQIFTLSSLHIKENIVNRLVELNAVDQLKKILKCTEGSVKETIIKFLVDNYNSLPEFLLKMFNETHDYKLKKTILVYLAEAKGFAELETLLDSEYKHLILPFLLENKISDNIFGKFSPIEIMLNLIYKKKYTFKEFFIKHKEILQFVFLEKMLAIYFFQLLRDRERLFLLFYHYKLFNFQEHKFELYDLKTEYIADYYKNTPDAKYNHLEESTFFKKVYNHGIKHHSKDSFILASLLDREQYNLNLSAIRKKFIIVSGSEERIHSEEKIKTSFAEKLKQAISKNEITSILKARDSELQKIINITLFKKIDNISKAKPETPYFSLPILKKAIRYSSKGIQKSLEELIKTTQVINDYKDFKDMCEYELSQKLIDLNDANEILKEKDKFDRNISSVISKNDFIYSIKKLGKHYNTNNDLFDYLSKIILSTEDLDTRLAVFEYYFKFNMTYWFRLLVLLINEKSVEEMRYYFIFKISDLYNEKCFRILLKMFNFEIKPKISNLKLFAGINKTEINDQLIEKKDKKIIVWDYKIIYLATLLNQMLYIKLKQKKKKNIENDNILDNLPIISQNFKHKIKMLLKYSLRND